MILVLLSLYTIIDGTELYEHDDSRDIEIVVRDIEQLQHAPVKINTAGLGDLQRIPFLTFTECRRMIKDREQNGPFMSPLDLERIPGFDAVLIEQILPFITFTSKHLVHEKTTVRLRGTTSLPWMKYRDEVYGRVICHTSPYTVYGVWEKDEHEELYLDYWTAGLIMEYGTGIFAFGKYNLDLGSGVMLSPIGSFYSTTDFHLMVRERGIIPYTSVNENSGFFGGAISDSLLLKFTLFYSNQKLDGRIDSMGNACSFDISGNHVDSASLDHKDRINEEIAGYDIKYKIGSVQIAQRTYWCRYEPSFICTDSLYRFYGAEFFMPGIQACYNADGALVFAEIARGHKDRIGGVGGFCGEFPCIDVTVVTRFFPAGYYSPKGAEAVSGTREGIIVLKNRSRIANVRAQIGIDGDLGGDTVIYKARLTAEKKIEFLRIKLQMRWQYQEQELDLSGSRVFLRIQASQGLWADVRLEERYVFTESSIDQGLYGCLELGTRFGSFTARIRYGLYSTESYDSRLYIYEIDLPGVVNNRMVYGKGSYGFLYGRFRMNKWFSLTAKHSILWKADMVDQEFGCQIDCTF